MRKQQAILKDHQSDIRKLLAHDLTLKEVINYPPLATKKITMPSLYKFSRENELRQDKNDNESLGDELKIFIDKTLKNRSKINLKNNKPSHALITFKKSLKTIIDNLIAKMENNYVITTVFAFFMTALGVIPTFYIQKIEIDKKEQMIQSLRLEIEAINQLPKDNLQKKEKAKK
jgi:hypothetical protein